MGLKTVIALLLGLVIQFSQVQSGVAASISACVGEEKSMSCCEGPESCPCISERSPDQKPAPLVPATVDLKWFAATASEADVLTAVVSTLGIPKLIPTRPREARAGYEGVPLSVSFCSFVI